MITIEIYLGKAVAIKISASKFLQHKSNIELDRIDVHAQHAAK